LNWWGPKGKVTRKSGATVICSKKARAAAASPAKVRKIDTNDDACGVIIVASAQSNFCPATKNSPWAVVDAKFSLGNPKLTACSSVNGTRRIISAPKYWA